MSGTRPATKRPRAPRAPAERPAQILDAAARVLLRDGVDATIDGIAAEAGLGKGTVYEYFGSKAQVFTALRNRCNEQILTAGTDALQAAPAGPALDRVRRFVAGMLEFGVTNAALVALLFHEVGIEEPDELAPIRASLLALVQAGVDAGELAVDDPAFTVEFLLHGLHGVLETTLAGNGSAESVFAQVDGVLAALLKPVPPPS